MPIFSFASEVVRANNQHRIVGGIWTKTTGPSSLQISPRDDSWHRFASHWGFLLWNPFLTLHVIFVGRRCMGSLWPSDNLNDDTTTKHKPPQRGCNGKWLNTPSTAIDVLILRPRDHHHHTRPGKETFQHNFTSGVYSQQQLSCKNSVSGVNKHGVRCAVKRRDYNAQACCTRPVNGPVGPRTDVSNLVICRVTSITEKRLAALKKYSHRESRTQASFCEPVMQLCLISWPASVIVPKLVLNSVILQLHILGL